MKLEIRVDGADAVMLTESRGRGRAIRRSRLTIDEAQRRVAEYLEKHAERFKLLDARHVERSGGAGVS